MAFSLKARRPNEPTVEETRTARELRAGREAVVGSL
jgi:hypothetical protein